MVKLVWLTDLHFVCAGEVVFGHDPSVRLDAAIDNINAHHSDAFACVISGDLVNRGDVTAYRELHAHLSRLNVAWIPMVGNHDDRTLLEAEFKPRVLDPKAAPFIQCHLKCDAGHVVCVDTQNCEADSGAYCADRYDWLEETLCKTAGEPVYLFMHHPPSVLGLPIQDQDKLDDGDKFLTFVNARANVRHMFIGHVHRAMSGTIGGIGFTTMRSCLYQAPPPWPAWNWDSFTPAAEAPSYGVIELSERDAHVHFIQFSSCEAGVKRTHNY